MAFWDLLKQVVPIGVFKPNVTYVNSVNDLASTLDICGMSPVGLWDSQPHLRTVVSFVARNVAQLGLHSYERVDETDRRRDRTSPAARALTEVDGQLTTYELVFALVGDLLLYDRAYWWVAPSSLVPSGTMIRRLPPAWVSEVHSDVFTVGKYRVTLGNKIQTIPAANVLAFSGYAPAKPGHGSSTVEALKQTLQEQIEASRYRAQVWKRGGRVSSVLERPKDAPQWSEAAREAFREDWYAKYTGRGAKAGGTPILEDGMTLKRVDFNAQEQQFVEAAKLSLSTVAAAFHVNPTMVGQMDNANYSNVREFRKMLYGDTLGPLIAQIEQRLNTFLLPRLGVDNSTHYVEFNIAEKLQGNFEEQSSAFQSSTGAPWMTRNEARARQNLPALPGGDDLVVPLNVLIGGQSSPNDSGSQNQRAGSVQVKARAHDGWDEKAQQVMAAFFARQEKVVRTRLGAKSPEWWDEDRWNGELTDDLTRLAASVAGEIGRATAQRLGFRPDDYDEGRTLAFLSAVAERRAKGVNAATRQQIEDALAAEEPADALDSVWNVAKGQRSGAAGAAVITAVSAFATTEAAKQVAGGRATKTWLTGSNPRSSHARMNGETVGIDEAFSNGMAWPGDSDDADEVAGCNCSISVDLPEEGSS